MERLGPHPPDLSLFSVHRRGCNGVLIQLTPEAGRVAMAASAPCLLACCDSVRAGLVPERLSQSVFLVVVAGLWNSATYCDLLPHRRYFRALDEPPGLDHRRFRMCGGLLDSDALC